ncbi:MAG: hypothetical protein ACRCTP_12800 [Aeromonas popoffii]|uniref:hypothetical protein n=1 Tax=Aeromonas popoffii TaxID=70856 RepID=UPI003F3EE2E9
MFKAIFLVFCVMYRLMEGQGSGLLSPQINHPIFNGGKRIADLDVAKVSTRQAVASYEKSIQTAFNEGVGMIGFHCDCQQPLQVRGHSTKPSVVVGKPPTGSRW